MSDLSFIRALADKVRLQNAAPDLLAAAQQAIAMFERASMHENGEWISKDERAVWDALVKAVKQATQVSIE